MFIRKKGPFSKDQGNHYHIVRALPLNFNANLLEINCKWKTIGLEYDYCILSIRMNIKYWLHLLKEFLTVVLKRTFFDHNHWYWIYVANGTPLKKKGLEWTIFFCHLKSDWVGAGGGGQNLMGNGGWKNKIFYMRVKIKGKWYIKDALPTPPPHLIENT